MKKLLALITVQILCIMFFCISVSAEESNPKYSDRANSWRYTDGQIADDMYGVSLIADDPYHPNATLKGIDVSKHQGVIDWEKVKASGIDFVIIRCGYAEDKTEYDDIRWEYNASECERLGIPYGVYLYSYAFNEAEARSEADHVLRLLKGHTPSLPIYYDMEDNSTLPYDHVAMANAFCQKISDAGYPVGIYASKYWWTTYLNSPTLDRWHRWVAQWGNECTYSGTYAIWQYTNKGRVDGITTDVDMNYLIGYPQDHNVLLSVKLSGGIVGDGSQYDGMPKLSWNSCEGAVVYKVQRTDENNDVVVFETSQTTFVDHTAKAGKEYRYSVTAISANGAQSKASNTVEIQAGIGVPETAVINVISSGKPKISWKSVKNVSGYEIYRKAPDDVDYQYAGTTDKQYFIDYGAQAGTVYFYRVRSVYRGEEDLRSFFSTPTYIVCRLPQLSVKAVQNKSRLNLSWNAQETAKGYNVYRADSWNGNYELVDTVKVNSYEGDLSAFYKVEAIHGESEVNGAVSDAVCSFYSSSAVPVNLEQITIEGNDTVKWRKIKGATCYEIYCSTNQNKGYKLVNVTKNTSWVNTSANADDVYYYRIRAVYCI